MVFEERERDGTLHLLTVPSTTNHRFSRITYNAAKEKKMMRGSYAILTLSVSASLLLLLHVEPSFTLSHSFAAILILLFGLFASNYHH